MIYMYKAVSPSMPFYESHRRRPIYYSGPPQDSRLFTEKPRDLSSKAVLRVHGRRPQCSSPECKSPPTNVFLLTCMPVVTQCIERLQHFNSASVQNFNVAVPFPSGACGSLSGATQWLRHLAVAPGGCRRSWCRG